MSPLAQALLAVATTLPPQYSPPERAEQAADERARFLPVLAQGIASAVEEAQCEDVWADSQDCHKKWPGSSAELAAMTLTLGWFESKLDPAIARGECPVWGKEITKISCDGERLTGQRVAPELLDNVRRNKFGSFVFHARSVFQIRNEVVDPEVFRIMLGDEEVPVHESARAAVKVISGARGTCRTANWETCTVRNYAGASASWPQTGTRVSMFRKIFARLQVEEALLLREANHL